jgi:hypothetical protein
MTPSCGVAAMSTDCELEAVGLSPDDLANIANLRRYGAAALT